MYVDKDGTLKKPVLVDQNEQPLHERIEVTINKQKLQIYGYVVGALLTVFTTLTYKVLDGIDTLKENSNDFKTYIKTNDLRVFYLERKLEEEIKNKQELTERLKKLEEDDAAFWRDYGYLFNQSKK